MEKKINLKKLKDKGDNRTKKIKNNASDDALFFCI